MITVEEAKRLMMAEASPRAVVEVPFGKAIQRFLSRDVLAPFDHPLFDNSAVDGYAFAFGEQKRKWSVVGEIPAGEVIDRGLKADECVRIFTGAMLPDGADTVVMQEYVRHGNGMISHSDDRLRQGGNVRLKGEQFGKGDTVLAQGTWLGPEAIGLLMSVGISRIPVHSAPRIAVVVTGSEFTSTEHPRQGHIFSSNDAMLVAALAGMDLQCTVFHAPDEDEALHRVFRSAITDHDVVITTGGVSVGDHDRVRFTLEDLGTRIVFHGVAQKPGKPMLFGRSDEKAVFGLPGNPRAVMVLFWEYVLPYLRALQGSSMPFLEREDLPITGPVDLKGDRAEFRAALVRGGEVTLLRDEGSHMLASLVRANALVYLSQGTHEVRSGERVEVHYLPGR